VSKELCETFLCSKISRQKKKKLCWSSCRFVKSLAEVNNSDIFSQEYQKTKRCQLLNGCHQFFPICVLNSLIKNGFESIFKALMECDTHYSVFREECSWRYITYRAGFSPPKAQRRQKLRKEL